MYKFTAGNDNHHNKKSPGQIPGLQIIKNKCERRNGGNKT